MTQRTKKFNGKVYEERGPVYCPSGTRWAWLKEEIQNLRDNGYLVRVQKIPLGKNMTGNTHQVWYYVRRK